MVPGAIADLLEDLLSEIQSARAVPLSNNVMINQEEILDRLHQAIEDLPEELRAARWMVREREAYIARTNEKARDMLVKAREESERLVSDNYVVQEAVEEANALVRNAESEGRRIRLEAEDFAERHLSEAESVLGELYRYITEARAELHKALPPAEPPPISK
jgi:cell division septum initiation protein DivIVA